MCAVSCVRSQVLFPNRVIADLPETRRGLSTFLNRALHPLLGAAIEVPLPNTSRKHDLLFIQQLLQQLSGVDETVKKPWMYMIWQVSTTPLEYSHVCSNLQPYVGEQALTILQQGPLVAVMRTFCNS